MYKFFFGGEFKYPKYVRFGSTILRHIPEENMYWCDNGAWGIAYWLDMAGSWPTLMSKRDEMFKKSERLITATEYEWIQSVGEYAPSDYILEDGTRWSRSKFIQGGYDEPDDDYDDGVDIEFTHDEDGNYSYRIKDNEMYLLLVC